MQCGEDWHKGEVGAVTALVPGSEAIAVVRTSVERPTERNKDLRREQGRRRGYAQVKNGKHPHVARIRTDACKA